MCKALFSYLLLPKLDFIVFNVTPILNACVCCVGYMCVCVCLLEYFYILLLSHFYFLPSLSGYKHILLQILSTMIWTGLLSFYHRNALKIIFAVYIWIYIAISSYCYWFIFFSISNSFFNHEQITDNKIGEGRDVKSSAFKRFQCLASAKEAGLNTNIAVTLYRLSLACIYQ